MHHDGSDHKKQYDDADAFFETLTIGDCDVSLLPSAGSTYSYMPTALYSGFHCDECVWRGEKKF